MTARTMSPTTARHAAATVLCCACALAALAAGCASSPPSRFYTLSSTAASATAPGASLRGVAVQVGPVQVPALVDRPQIVVSAGANEVRLEEFHRWAVPLQDNLTRVIADDLIALLGTPRVTAFPQTPAADPDYRVAVEVRRYESAPGAAATLDAAWSVRRTRDGREQRGRTSVREPVQNGGFGALAAAHSRAAGRLSQDITLAIRALETAAPK